MIRTEFLHRINDMRRSAKSLVIPLPRGRALRVGFAIERWCFIGPRRYRVVATDEFVKSFATIGGEPEEEARERLRDMGVEC